MPRFTLIKHADGPYDAEVKVDFQAEVLDLARAHYEDFLQAAGFELPPKVETTEDWLEKAEDAMWDDAFSAKFNINAAEPVRMDGLVGGAGADVIDFGDYKKEPFIPTFHD
jgi:hypothetical protein